MSNDILVYVEHLNGEITDATFELIAVARSLAGQTGGGVDAAVIGSDAAILAGSLGGADRILVGETDDFGAFNPQGHASVFADIEIRDVAQVERVTAPLAVILLGGVPVPARGCAVGGAAIADLVQVKGVLTGCGTLDRKCQHDLFAGDLESRRAADPRIVL